MMYPQEHYVAPTGEADADRECRNEQRYQIVRRAYGPTCEGRPIDGPRALTMVGLSAAVFIVACVVFGAANVLMFIGGLAVATGALLVISKWM